MYEVNGFVDRVKTPAYVIDEVLLIRNLKILKAESLP